MLVNALIAEYLTLYAESDPTVQNRGISGPCENSDGGGPTARQWSREDLDSNDTN